MAGGIETILLVDDEKSILDFGRRVLSNFGYTVLTASDGEGALEIYQNEKGKVDLIILDLIMPGMGGQRCLEELLRISPEAKVIIASGYSIDGHPKTMIEAGARAFVNKPYDIKQILKIIRTVLDGKRLD
jgi:CheY-like chemotaxis protein